MESLPQLIKPEGFNVNNLGFQVGHDKNFNIALSKKLSSAYLI